MANGSLYMIYSLLGLEGKRLVLGTHRTTPTQIVLCVGEPGDGLLVWSLREIPGAPHMFLKHEDSGLYARFGERNAPITLAKLDPQDKLLAVMLQESQDGYVLIRNHEGSLVMGTRNGGREDGTRIVAMPSGSVPHVQWLFGPPTA